MQVAHKEDYDKLCLENEVDKSSILRSRKGQVFVVEMVDKSSNIEHTVDHTSKEENKMEGNSTTEVISDKGRKRMIRRSDSNIDTNSIKRQTRAMSRENSFVRQSSMLSEISQSININNISDLVEKFGNNGNIKNESFGILNRAGSKNSSFVSNGLFGKNNSFKMTSFSHPADNSIIKQANDKFFEEIDDEGGNDYIKRENLPNSSFKFYGNNSFKVNEPNSFLFKKPSFQVSPQLNAGKGNPKRN
mmetsp:Transcript_27335/g.24217  ORF Transcript_27335/g.24217 Transcript_27335/m.24217 type:complete len:246 (-) Transcript_27335:66-803(-)